MHRRGIPGEAMSKAGYHAVWRGQRTWNGVAILARSEPVVTRMELPGDAEDKQARYLEAAVDGILFGCIYLPNGNPQPASCGAREAAEHMLTRQVRATWCPLAV